MGHGVYRIAGLAAERGVLGAAAVMGQFVQDARHRGAEQTVLGGWLHLCGLGDGVCAGCEHGPRQ